MNKNGELSILTFIVGFLVVLGIFSAVFIFAGYFTYSNNASISTNSSPTFHEVNAIISDLNDN